MTHHVLVSATAALIAGGLVGAGSAWYDHKSEQEPTQTSLDIERPSATIELDEDCPIPCELIPFRNSPLRQVSDALRQVSLR